MKAKLSSLSSSKGFDEVDVINEVSEIMEGWFGSDDIWASQKNARRYYDMRGEWLNGVSYEFIDYNQRWFETEDPIMALDLLRQGVELVMVDHRAKEEWENKYGIEAEY